MSAGRKAVAALCAAFALASAAAADQLIGVRDDGALVTFDSTSPSTFASAVNVIGRAVIEKLSPT